MDTIAKEIKINGNVYILRSNNSYKCSNCSSSFNSNNSIDSRSGHSSKCRLKKSLDKKTDFENLENNQIKIKIPLSIEDFRDYFKDEFWEAMKKSKTDYFQFSKSEYNCFVKKIKKGPKFSFINAMSEINIGYNLTHKNLMKTYTYFEDSSCLYIVSEKFGINLNEFIKSQRNILDKSLISEIFLEIAYGIKFLHENKIIHLDIKPKNILYSNSKVKIADFGLSSKLGIEEEFQGKCGTEYYQAPEVINSSYSYKSDIWSLGCTLAYMYFPLIVESKLFSEDPLSFFKYLSEREKRIFALIFVKKPDLRIDINELINLWLEKS